MISLRTGLRWSNVVGSQLKPGLLWKHVDLDAGVISIARELMKNRLPYRAPIHVELLEELRRQLKELRRVPKHTDADLRGLGMTVGPRKEVLAVAEALATQGNGDDATEISEDSTAARPP